jgi:ABC-type bacteriocin/lantibiotic exporter with double-glycine peptidase domain
VLLMKSTVYNKALPKAAHLDRNSIWNANKFNNGLSSQFRVTEFQHFMNFFLQFLIKISTGFILVWIINCVVTGQLTLYFYTGFLSLSTQ